VSFQPFVFLLYSSLHHLDAEGAFGRFTFAHFAAIFSSRAFGPTLVNSLVYSFARAVALIIARRKPGSRTYRREPAPATLCCLDSIARIPYVLYIVAWLLLLGKAGPVNLLLQADVWRHHALHQRVFARRNDLCRGTVVVAARLFLLLPRCSETPTLHSREAASICGAGFVSVLRSSPSAWRSRRVGAWPSGVHQGMLRLSRCRHWSGLPGSARVFTSTIYTELTLAIPPTAAWPLPSRAAARHHGGAAADLPPHRGADPSLPDRHRKDYRPRVVRLGAGVTVPAR